MQVVGILDHALWITVFKTTLVDEATSFADDLDEDRVTKWPELKDKFITRYRGAINPIMVMDTLAKVQHKKGEPVLAYINRFRTEAKWLPPEEANSPMVASLFLRNMQPNINDPCCVQFQQGKCTMVQLYQGAQEIQKRFDWKGTRRPRLQSTDPMLEDSEEYQSTGPPEDSEKGVGDTPEVKVNSPRVENMAAPPRRRGRPRKDKAGPIGGNVRAECKKETQQFAQQIRDQQAEEEASKASVGPTKIIL
ncbi:hypothetical protein R1flu_022257 [Riccia fluitans]|uniref:Retrotransposon gag domain-containing protein n=1 Tax=Riccia fluitans TaxID=41844 RepID=A0ABD1ZUK2_9MARC